MLEDRLAPAALSDPIPTISSPQTNTFVLHKELNGFADYGRLFVRQASAETPANPEAASAGGGLRLGWPQYVNLDLQLAKAIEGPRRDWRAFFLLAAKY